MFSWLRRSSTPFLAIDVSSESVQLLEVTATKKQLQLHQYVHQPLPLNCVVAARIIDIPAFSHSLIEATTQFKPINKKVALALPVNQVISKTIPLLSHLTPTEVTQHIQQEILTQTPAPLADIYWDYAYLPTHSHARAQEATAIPKEIIVSIAQRSSITPYLQAIHASGLSLQVVDVESYALARVWRYCYPTLIPSSHLQAILFLRTHLITLVLLKGTAVFYTRAWPLEMTTTYEVAFLPGVQQLWRALPITATWPDITHIWLAGECALPAYATLVSTALHLPAALIEFPSNLFLPEKDVAPTALFLCLGLALWGTRWDKEHHDAKY